MIHPLRDFLRRRALRRGRSTAPTSLLPMSAVRSAVVFVDGTAGGEDPAVAARLAQRLLADRGIDVQVLCPTKRELDWLGRLKPAQGAPAGGDLFLSLAASPDCFAAAYAAACSTARFKAGRCALPSGIYDLVVASPRQEGPDSQAEAFTAILEYLDKIQ